MKSAWLLPVAVVSEQGTVRFVRTGLNPSVSVRQVIVTLVAVFLVLSPVASGVVTAAPHFPQTAVNVPIPGTENWGNPGGARQTGAFSRDGVAFVDLGTLVVETESAALVATNFGFAVPNGATIQGIKVVVERDGQQEAGPGSGNPRDFGIFIMKGGVPVGVDHSNSKPWSGSFPDITYGGSTDLWGESWTAADINDPGFGLSIRARNTGLRAQGRVDSIRITVFFQENCQVILDNNLYRCQSNQEGFGLSEVCLQFVSPGTLSAKFDLVVEGAFNYGCTCKAKGTVDEPDFNASQEFFCVDPISSASAAALEGEVSSSGEKITGGFFGVSNGVSGLFTCELDPTCTP